jgi:hypothetical protein
MDQTINGVRYADARILVRLPGYRQLHVAEHVELTFDAAAEGGAARGAFLWSESRAQRFRRELGALETPFDIEVRYLEPAVRPGVHLLTGCLVIGEPGTLTPFTIGRVGTSFGRRR